MGTQGTGRKRSTKKERSTAEDDALNLIAREAEARLAAKRAARAEAREIRMKELERQQKEIFQVQKKYYGLDTKVDDRGDSKWGDIEQWMEESERYSRSSRIHTLSDDDERMSVGSRGSVRSDLDAVGAYSGGGSSLKKSKKKKKHKHKDRDKNGYDDDYSVLSSRSSRLSDESRVSRSSRLDLTSSRLSDDSRVSRASRLDLQPAAYASSDLYSLNGLSSSRNPGSAFNGYQFYRSLSQSTQQLYRRSSLYEDSLCSGSRRGAGSTSHPLEYSSYRSSGSRVSSRANSARASPVDNCGSVASFLRSAASSSGLPRDLDDVTIPDFSDVEDRDYLEKGSRAASALTAGTLTSLGGTSSRRGSGETAITVDAETSLREIKDALAEVEEKYRKAMVSNAQLDNEKNNLMYQVDTLKDSLMDLEELLSESRREYDEKVKEFEREKHAHSVLQFQFSEMKEMLKQSEELLNEIRQLRLKQEAFVREIADLQETVEWKDKKIGALERQKEYTDAIRVERDELREEVVKLKDILKKHGIVLGPDLNVNGDIGEAEVDGSPSADPASQPTPDSQTSPTEGNSMLGNTEETQLRSSGEEEVDPEQHQEMSEEAKENHLSSDTLDNVADVSTLETPSDEQPKEEQQTFVATEEDIVGESGLSKDLNVEINDCLITETKEIIVCSSELQVIVTSSEENVLETEIPEAVDLGETSNPDSGETETKNSSVDTDSDNIRESNNILKEQEKTQEHVEESNLSTTESCPQQKVSQEVVRESSPDEAVPAVSSTEFQQEPENADEAENDEAEEISRKSVSQGATASGKRKRKKKRGKKKGGTHEDKNQQKYEADKEKGKTEKDIESATRGNGPLTEPDSSLKETLKELSGDQVKNEQDRQETEEVHGVEAVKPTETFSDNETLKESKIDHDTDEHKKEQTLDVVEEVEAVTVVTIETIAHVTPPEIRVDHVMDKQNKEQSLETETEEAVETAAATETFSHTESLKESDPKKDEQGEEQSLETETVTVPTETFFHVETLEEDEQDKDQSLETETVEVLEAVAPTETLSDIETLKESITDLKEDEQGEEQSLETETEEEGSRTNPVPEANLSTPDLIDNSRGAENTDGLDEVCTSSVDNSKSGTDILTNGSVIHTESELVSSAEDEVGSINKIHSECTTNGLGNTNETNGKENTEGESPDPSNDEIATDESESKNNTLGSSSSPDDVTGGHESFPGLEPPSQSAAMNLGSDDSPIKVSDRDPEEATEIVKNDEEPGAETKQETFSTSMISPSPDKDNSELKPDRTEEEELSRDLREPEGLVEQDTEKSLLETVAQVEQLDDVQSETLQCKDQIAEVSSETEESKIHDMLNTLDSPKEAAEVGSFVEQDHSAEESAVTEDPEHNSQNDHQSETLLELLEPSKDKSEDKDSFQPTLQDGDEEDGDDDEEGQSFDFDDMDIEGAVVTNDKQEEVEEGVEVMSDDGSSGLCQSNMESNENNQDETVKNNDEKCADDTLVKETGTMPHQGATSENVCEQQKEMPVQEIVVAHKPGHVIEEGKGVIVGELGDVAENINQAMSLPVEEGLDAIKHELQGDDLVLPKSADQTKKDVKKNSKKGKAKGKEECKMS
ncbi:clumping factor A isoform X3 [Larimichthys crocea]|uniref:clumping factor A isoform X3 n=1 Tax=Larimichthys crocea TaxID=215358 RepID=UPI000F5E7EE0|nr:clumping factor A isoform X3 [Larimichthys crocea]